MTSKQGPKRPSTKSATRRSNEGQNKRAATASSYGSFSSTSVTLDERWTLPGFTARKPRKSKLPRPLKNPRTYKPRYLSSMEEQILARRLSKIPERWQEGYGEEIKQQRLFKAMKVSEDKVDKIVRRLSTVSKKDSVPKETTNEEDDFLFDFENKTKKDDGERKLEENEIEKLVARLSKVSTRNTGNESNLPERQNLVLLPYEIEQLTARLNRPKVYVDNNVPHKVTEANVRFRGTKMSQKEIEEMVERISFKGMKKEAQDDRARRQQIGYFATWTPCDEDYKQWRLMNRKMFSNAV